MIKIYITASSRSYQSDAFNNNMFTYTIRYDGPDSYGYPTIMTTEAYARLVKIISLSCEIVYSEV